MAEATVVRVGTDSSGRPIYMTRKMRRWYKRVCIRLGFKPTVIQGAWMVKAGGGAKASAGYHDGGGCLDLRTRDLTPAQIGLTRGATQQWADYIAGRDGLASRGPDYHWRPNPLVLTPPPAATKTRKALQEAIDEAARVGLPVADKLRKIKDRIRKW